ncbi:MAG: translocation/assembly module TamB domain-containing protein [Enhygromyxa sp.]
MAARRRWWRWLLLGIGGLLLAIVGLVVAIVWIPAVSQLVITEALTRWDASNPARLRWRSIEGSLGAGLRVVELELLDGEARPLVLVERLELELGLRALLGGVLEVERLELLGVEVWADHQWRDLADPEAPPSPPKPGYGPDLPIEIVATVAIIDGRVWLDERELVELRSLQVWARGRGREAEAELLAEDIALPAQQLRVDTLALAARWDEPIVHLDRLELVAPLVEIERLHGTYDVSREAGELTLEADAPLDALGERFGLDLDAFGERASIELVARGGPRRLEFGLDLDLGAAGGLRVDGAGVPSGPTGQRWAGAHARGRVDPEVLGVLLEDARAGPLRFELRAGIRGRERLPGFVASLVAELEDFRSDERLRLAAEARASSIDPLAGFAALSLRGAGLELDASLERDPVALRGRWSLRSPALGRPLALAAALLGRPELAELRGRLTASGRCEGQADSLASLRCPLELRLRRARGFGVALDDLRVQARVEPFTDPLALDVSLVAAGLRPPGTALVFDHLRAEAHGTLARLQVDLEGSGAHEQVRVAGALELGERIEIAVDQLALRSDRGGVSTALVLRRPTRLSLGEGTLEMDALSLAAAGGTIDADGRLGFGPGTQSDLRLEVEGLSLARLDPLLPGPSLAGRLSLRATLSGALPEPSLGLQMRGQGLRIAGLRPGDVELFAAFGQPAWSEPLARLLATELGDHPGLDEGLRVWARVRGPMAARLELAAAIPLGLAGGAGLIAGRELAARVVVESLDLLELGALMPATPSWWQQRAPDAAAPLGEPRLIPEGLVDLDLRLAGPPERPRARATLLARELVVDRSELGSLLARASFDDTGLGVELSAKPGFGQLELRARAPARLDLVARELDWDPDAQQLVSLDLRGLELGRLRAVLGPKLPALEQALAQAQIDAVVSLGLRAAGSLDEPSLLAALQVGDLQHRNEQLGGLRVFAAYVPGEAELELDLDGPIARRLDARIVAPLRLPSAGEPLRLDPRGRLLAQVRVEELALGSLAPHVGPLPIAGQLGVALDLRGSPADPRVELRARVDELAGASGAPLGELLVQAGFEAGRAWVDADMVRAGAPILAAGIELPLLVELSEELVGSTIRWDRQGHHRVFATARHLDEELLGALLGREFGRPRTVAALEGRRETELAFDIAGGGRIDAFRIAGALSGRLAVDDRLALALDLGLELDEAEQRVELSLMPAADPAEQGSVSERRADGLVGFVELGAAVPALLAGEGSWAEVPLRASVVAPSFELRSLAPLLPRSVVDPDGRLHADLSGRGTLGAPQLRGELELDDAAITVIPLRQRLSAVNLELTLDERSIDLRRVSLRAGRGGVEGSGRAELIDGGGFDAAAEIAIDSVPLIRPGLPAMTVDTRVDLDLRRRPGATRVAVGLLEPKVTVAGVTEASPDPIPSSPDVVFLSRVAPSIAPASQRSYAAAPEQPGEPPGEPADAERFELRVVLRDPLLISGASIDMAWAGAVELIIDEGEIEVGGEVEARRGRLRLFGNSFDLRRGIVTLPADGTLDPYLDLEAVSELPQAEVTVTVRGRVSRPSLEFSSNPALSEYQILTLLVTGSIEIGEGEGDVAAKAASLLAAVSNPQLQSQLNQRLGIDRVALGFGESIDQPILTVGKRFGRDVYVETQYHHNAPDDQNTTQLAIEYTIRRRWALEGFFGDAAVGALGLYWTRSFPQAPWSTDLELPDLLGGR